ncbi:MAG: YggT family protein [Clostridia bacterium]
MLGYMLSNIIGAMQMVLLIRAIMSWFPDVAGSNFGQFIYSITEPVLAPVRDFLRTKLNLGMMPIDLSFLLVYIGLSILSDILRFL